MNNQEIMSRIETLQGMLNCGSLNVNAPCGPEPVVNLLGGLHARTAINETSGKFPEVENELAVLEKLIKMLDD